MNNKCNFFSGHIFLLTVSVIGQTENKVKLTAKTLKRKNAQDFVVLNPKTINQLFALNMLNTPAYRNVAKRRIVIDYWI